MPGAFTMSIPLWKLGTPVNGSGLSPKYELILPCTGYMNRFPRIRFSSLGFIRAPGRNSSCPTEITELASMFQSSTPLKSTPQERAMPWSVSPRRTTYFSPSAFGMFRTDPAGMPRPSRMLFQLTRVSTFSLKRDAIFESVSPDWVL